MTANIGALTQAPRHSTSEIVNILSLDVSPTLMPIVFLQASSTSSEPRSQHGVVVHTWMWYFPVGFLKHNNNPVIQWLRTVEQIDTYRTNNTHFVVQPNSRNNNEHTIIQHPLLLDYFIFAYKRTYFIKNFYFLSVTFAQNKNNISTSTKNDNENDCWL